MWALAVGARAWKALRRWSWLAKEDIVAIATVNPATGETVQTFDEMSEADVDRRLTAAATAHASYRLTTFDERARWMRAAAGILDDEQDQIAGR